MWHTAQFLEESLQFLNPNLFQLNATSELVFEADIGTMLSTSKCIRTQNCFLYFHLGDPDKGPIASLPLDVFKNAQGLGKAQVQVRGRTMLCVLCLANLVCNMYMDWFFLVSKTTMLYLFVLSLRSFKIFRGHAHRCLFNAWWWLLEIPYKVPNSIYSRKNNKPSKWI